MPLTIPRPFPLQPRIPSLFVIGLLAAQYLVFGLGNSPEPKCSINIERPHYSSYLYEYKKIDAIKLNITTKCNVPQRYTEITSSIQKIENNRQATAHKFESDRRYSKTKSPHVVIFEELYATCVKGSNVAYSGEAKGYIHLKHGQDYPIQGSSGKFVAVSCKIVAK
ncbi:MAG: hypothetical protein H7227_04550 [Actinobacteria bacterium]|nr:hypothetical protein [Actinomycetota bacterium]